MPLADERQLWREREKSKVREELVRRHMDFARGLALSYRTDPEPVDDLIQVAYFGLLKALERFDPSRGIPFRAFASPTITGELKRHFRDRVSPVKIPRGLYERMIEIDSARGNLSADLQRSPSVSEIADKLNSTEKEIIEAIEAKQARYPVSMEGSFPVGMEYVSPAERIGEEDGSFEQVEDSLSLREVLSDLPEMEQRILRLRFRDEMTQAEIADRLGYSQMHISRILRRTLDRLRSTLPRAAA